MAIDTSFTIARIEARSFRVPITAPVVTSFGAMRDRPAVFVQIFDQEGNTGLGEMFANWPAAGAEHRVNLLMDDIADLLAGRRWDNPQAMYEKLEATTRIRARQCGELGPFDQVIAGLDVAAWDLVARRDGRPVAKLIADTAATEVPTYASGVSIDVAFPVIERMRAEGLTRFKVKVGFDQTDAEQLRALAQSLQPGEQLFADANQAWTEEEATAFVDDIEGTDLGWLEEPLPVFAPTDAWRRLAGKGVPLAGGENIAGSNSFDQAIAEGALSYFQPDVVKWGGISGCLHVARRVQAAGRIYCPHFLGGGIGLAASAHLLAAVGGGGLLELDANPNPLRTEFFPQGFSAEGGTFHLGSAPGLGIDHLPQALDRYETLYRKRCLAAAD